MKKILTTIALLSLAISNALAQSADTKLNVLLNNEKTLSFSLLSSPKATFSGSEMTITSGEDVQSFPIKDLNNISYSERGGNVCVYKDAISNVNIDFDRIYPNKMTVGNTPAIRIEAEDIENILECKSGQYEVVDVLPQYADRVSGKLIHLTPSSRTSNPSITYGNLHITGKYNIYLVTVPGIYVNAEDTLDRTRKIRFTCTHYTSNGASYYQKTNAFSTNPDNSSEKLMIDHSDIDTLLIGRSFESPSIAIDSIHSSTFKFQSQRLSSEPTVNDFYLDCIILVPVDSEGNEQTECNTLVMEHNNLLTFVPTDSLEYIEWQKEQIVVDEEIKVPYSKTCKISYSFIPSFITYPSVTMESENPDIASVDKKGVITGNSIGSTYVTLTDNVGGAVAKCKITVTGTPATANSLIVNEVMSGNLDQFVDPSFNYGAWVELYNPSDEDLIIARCYVSNDPNNITKFRLSSKAGIVPAHSFRNIWFDHSEYTADQIPFKLDYDGGTIYFSDANGNLIVSQDYPAMIARCSYARKTDRGEEWGWTGYPTPEESNNASVFATEQVDDPEVSIQSCIYDELLEFQVLVPDGAKLLYTTNGSVPTEENSKVSEDGSFTISSHAALRFRAFKEGYLPSNVVTRSFIRADNYMKNGVDIRQLPIISIVTANANLNSDELGIFVQGKNGRPGNGHSSSYNTNMDWDRPVDFQYFKDGEYVFSQEVDIATCGGWSRTYGAHSSFKIKADKKYYGLKTLDYPFFDQKPYLKNKTLQIRNGGNDYNARIKDAALQTIVMRSDLDIDCQSYQPTIHFINGKSYGIINMREPNNKHFVYANYGWDSDEIDVFEMGPDSAYCQNCGTKDAFNDWYELSKRAADPIVYNEICQRFVDVDEFINYVAVEMYLANWDWPQNNLKGFRHRDGGKFRFVLYDLDNTLQSRNPFTNFFGKKTYTFDTCYPEMTKMTAEIEFVTIFENMLKNEDFKKKFIDTYCMVGATLFETSNVDDICWDVLERVGDIQYELEGYNKSPHNTIYNIMDAFADNNYNSNARMFSYLFNQSLFSLSNDQVHYCTVFAYVDDAVASDAPILYNGMKMPTNYLNGYAYYPLTLTALPMAGKQFEGWYEIETGELMSADAEYSLPDDPFQMEIVAVYSNLPQEDISAQGLTPVRINEVSAANAVYANDYFKREDWVEFYNTTDEDIDMGGMYVSNNPDNPEKYQITADGTESTIIPANGYKVIWFDKKAGISQLHAPFKLDDDGDVLYLTAADHSWTDSLAYAEHDGNHTIGRYPDGSDSIYVMNMPTIEKRNMHTSYLKSVRDGKIDTTVIKSILKGKNMEIAYHNDALSIKANSSTNATLNIFSIDGRKVLSTKEQLAEGTNSVSLSTLASGTYLVFVKADNGEWAKMKFIK